MNIIEQLKRFDENTMTVVELVALRAQAKLIQNELSGLSVSGSEVELIDNSVRKLTNAINAKTRDAVELRLRQINAEQSNLETASEKRARLAVEKAALEAQLATK